MSSPHDVTIGFVMSKVQERNGDVKEKDSPSSRDGFFPCLCLTLGGGDVYYFTLNLPLKGKEKPISSKGRVW